MRDRSKSSLPWRLSATFAEKAYHLTGQIMFLLLPITIWFILFALPSFLCYCFWHNTWGRALMRLSHVTDSEVSQIISPTVRMSRSSPQGTHPPSLRECKEEGHGRVGTTLLFWMLWFIAVVFQWNLVFILLHFDVKAYEILQIFSENRLPFHLCCEGMSFLCN